MATAAAKCKDEGGRMKEGRDWWEIREKLTAVQPTLGRNRIEGALSIVELLRAGRLLLAEISDKVARGESFAFETTLSGQSYARSIPRWQSTGYHVKIIFLSLSDPEIAIARVAARVAQGGHNVPEPAIRRRLASGLNNFHRIYRDLADAWALYDNSGPVPLLLEWNDNR